MAFLPAAAPAGGFLHSSVLSPAPSSVTSMSTVTGTLPHPRSHPLKPGGTKESALVRFIDAGMLKIERRYAKRGTNMANSKEEASTRGYEDFREVIKDIENLFDLIWVSGTPSLQVPYLLTLASLIEQYLPSFEAVPRDTFKLLQRFDMAFASLLQGRHVETGDSLPGFDTGRKVTGTEKVRMKSIVERTRGVVVEVMSRAADEDDENRIEDLSEIETGDEMDVDDVDAIDQEQFSGIEMNVSKVYDRTIVELGDTIGAAPIGIISDD